MQSPYVLLCLYAPSIWTNKILSYCAFPGSGSQKSFVYIFLIDNWKTSEE